MDICPGCENFIEDKPWTWGVLRTSNITLSLDWMDYNAFNPDSIIPKDHESVDGIIEEKKDNTLLRDDLKLENCLDLFSKEVFFKKMIFLLIFIKRILSKI